MKTVSAVVKFSPASLVKIKKVQKVLREKKLPAKKGDAAIWIIERSDV